MPELPDTVWDGHDFTSIHAAVLLARLERIGAISSTLAPVEYDCLVNDFQRSMLGLIESLQQQGMPVAEARISSTPWNRSPRAP